MKRMNHLVWILVPALFLMQAGCDKDSGTNAKEELIGTWKLVELIINFQGIPANLIEYLGLDITLTVRADGTYTLTTVKTADTSTKVESGIWTAGSKTVTINPEDGDPKTMEYSVDGNMATLKTTLPNVVDQNDEDLMSSIPADMFHENGTLKETPVTLVYTKVL